RIRKNPRRPHPSPPPSTRRRTGHPHQTRRPPPHHHSQIHRRPSLPGAGSIQRRPRTPTTGVGPDRRLHRRSRGGTPRQSLLRRHHRQNQQPQRFSKPVLRRRSSQSHPVLPP